MKLDVVVPTYNRSALLRRTIASLLDAPVPAGLEVTLYVADNNSQDDTAEVIRQMSAPSPLPIRHVLETRQSSSYARNAGINAGTGEIIGFVDDDEQIDTNWYSVIEREFRNPEIQYIGGPCLADASVPMPSWLPPGYNGVIGVIAPKPRGPFGPSFPGNLNSGNAVIRRTVFERVGEFNTSLGRSGQGLLSEEDAELYRRILAAGLYGEHVPDLIIYHHVPVERLTRHYHQRWCYWRGISQGVAARVSPEKVRHSFGVPRYRIGRAVQGVFAAVRDVFSGRTRGDLFARQLAIYDLLGFINGRFFARVERFYPSQGKAAPEL